MTGDPTADDNSVQQNYGSDEFDMGSKFQDVLDYPIYYDNAVDNDETNGRVVLCDCRQTIVNLVMNQIPTLQVTYPRDGLGAKIMQTEGIIMTDCNRNWTHQKFRIKQITKDTDQLIINANHIIGDFADLTLYKNVQLPDATCSQVFDALMLNATLLIPDARYTTDINDVRNVDIDMTNERLSNCIFDADAEGDKATQSLVGLYGGELMADNYHLYHYHKLGRDSGVVIHYGERIQSFQQDKNIENTYTAIYPYAKYTSGQAIATLKNTDWNQWFGDWDGRATVQYNAGGSISLYDAPVEGASVIGTIGIATHLKVGKAVSNGDFTPDGKLQINTINSDTWYPVETSVGDGWVDSAWITFSKNGDYLVNDATGHIHTAISEDDSKNTHYPVKGTGTVNWTGKSHQIRVFYSPDKGKGYRPTGKVLKTGKRFHYDQVAIDENGEKWYRIGVHQWIYGPHVKVDSEQDIAHYKSKGKGYVKEGAIAYHIDKHGMMVPKTHKGKLVTTRDKKHPKKKTVMRGRGKKKHKVTKIVYPKKKHHKIEKDKLPKGYKNLNYDQVTVGNTIYYKVSNGTYVKSSGIDWKKPRSRKPTLPKDMIKANAAKKGYIEMYSAPAKGKSLNITVPVNKSFDVTHTAQGTDGNTWYEITYNGHTGWIPAADTTSTADGDLEPTAVDKAAENPNSKDPGVTQSEVFVSLGDGEDGLVYPEDGITHEVPRVLNVDLSAYIKHDDQDLSGQQPDGSFVATDDDKAQLRAVAEQYVIEHRIGKPVVSLSVSYAQSDDIEGDLTALNLYDLVTVVFEPYDVAVKAEVTSAVYNPLAKEYTSINVGDIPKTWQHLLVESANKKTEELQQRTRENFKHTSHLFQNIHEAMKLEGKNREEAERKIAKSVDLTRQITLKNGETIDKLKVSATALDKRLQAQDAKVTQLSQSILNGGSAELQFVDASGNSNFLHPTSIRAYNPDGSFLEFNSNGIGYFNQSGLVRTGMNSDGTFAAENIIAGYIDALNMTILNIDGGLHIDSNDGGNHIDIDIGNQQDPTGEYSGHSRNGRHPGKGMTIHDGFKGVQVKGNRYHTQMSQGYVGVYDSSAGHYIEIHPTYISYSGEDLKDVIKGWMHQWLHDTVTITKRGDKKPIWR